MCDFFSKYIPKTEFRFLSVLSVTLFLAALQAGCGHVDGSAETDSVSNETLSEGTQYCFFRHGWCERQYWLL